MRKRFRRTNQVALEKKPWGGEQPLLSIISFERKESLSTTLCLLMSSSERYEIQVYAPWGHSAERLNKTLPGPGFGHSRIGSYLQRRELARFALHLVACAPRGLGMRPAR